MAVRWYSIVVDSKDVAAQGRWWAEVLDWRVVYEAEDEVVIVPPRALEERATEIPLDEQGPGLVFVTVPEGKTVKNRLHIDLAPGPDDDHAAEVARLEGMGARRVNVGQDESVVPWVVMADPEGNEFCVLTPRG
ncbi:VOC family protein [Leifsonia bigeumensis]|uniref:VOC family protein n=1 Tax=Leifsonella bigeumensis TaxID=433643 RepID=A0ABP7FR24_9MICO